MGLPNATVIWQVGNSTAQNGMFKKGLWAAAVHLQKLQVENCEPIRIKDHDIIPMVMSAHPDSFGNMTTNKRVILSQGWNPLNRNCLLNPQIVRTRGNEVYKSNNDFKVYWPSSPPTDSVSTLTTSNLSDISSSTIARSLGSAVSPSVGLAASIRSLRSL